MGQTVLKLKKTGEFYAVLETGQNTYTTTLKIPLAIHKLTFFFFNYLNQI